MRDLVDFIKSFDLHTIIVVGVAFWWLNGNIAKLDEKINDIDRRLSRIESNIIR